MKTIKFRAWDKDANCMAYSENQNDYWWETNPLRCGYIAGESGGNQFEPPEPVADYCDNVMQFTGLQDKNGKDIYEGDIVKTSGLLDNIIGEVIWRNFTYEIKPKSWNSGYRFYSIGQKRHFEVIGNIHENPELLK